MSARIAACFVQGFAFSLAQSPIVEAGYRSKKDFYDAFRTVIGSTPGQFRELPQAQRALVLATIRDRLVMRHAEARL